eukprot:243066_1
MATLLLTFVAITIPSTAAEIISNLVIRNNNNITGKTVTYECGVASCSVTCYDQFACSNAVINMINITSFQCNHAHSCQDAILYISGNTPLEMTFEDSLSIIGLIAFIELENQSIMTKCSNDSHIVPHLCRSISDTCLRGGYAEQGYHEDYNSDKMASMSSFYYNGKGSIVTHRCVTRGCCGYSLISAINIDAIHLECLQQHTCHDMDIYLPISSQYNSTIYNLNEAQRLAPNSVYMGNIRNKVYSLNGMVNLILLCDDFYHEIKNCFDPNSITYMVFQFYLIYGLRFEKICAPDPLIDVSCLVSSDVYRGYSDWVDGNVTILQIKNATDIDFSTENLSEHLVVFVSKEDHVDRNGQILRASDMLASMNVFCIDGWRTSTCNGMTFDFRSSLNATLIANSAQNCTIYGPTNYFKRVSYGYNSTHNTYHLQNTVQIDFGEDVAYFFSSSVFDDFQNYSVFDWITKGMFGSRSKLYSGSSTDVQMHCISSSDCINGYIYSSLNPNNYTSLIDMGWQTIVEQENTVLHIEFISVGKLCDITFNTSNCGFLTASPTFSPTTSPTLYPTSSPSFSPTIPPTSSPTYVPTSSPSMSPTLLPSVPTIVPSVFTYSPSNLPTDFPTMTPSKSPTAREVIQVRVKNSNLAVIGYLCLTAFILIMIFVALLYYCRKKKKVRISEINLELLSRNVRNVGDRSQDNNTLDECRSRLRDIMKQYQVKYDDETYIDSTNIARVLNDYHILLDCDEGTLFDKAVCTSSTCQVFRRHFRDRFNDQGDELKLYKSISMVNNTQTIAKKQILDKIHCYCQHSIVANPTENVNSQMVKSVKDRMNRKFNQLYDAQQFIPGWKFVYIENHKKFNFEEQKDELKECVVIKPIHNSLKVEMSHNKFITMTKEAFDNELYKAQVHFNSYYRKSMMKSNPKWRNITMEHLLSIMIYCNFDKLQNEFSKTYRESHGLDHSHFFNLGKLMQQAVLKYGMIVRKGGIDHFYHGITQTLIPTVIVGDLGRGIRIFCPLSTSSSEAVAVNFADTGKGMIMTFGGNTCKAKYFSAAWLSDYASEKEHIFLQNEEEIQIMDIADCVTNTHFQIILDGLKAMDAFLFEAHFFEDHNSINTKDNIMDTVLKIMYHQLSINLESTEFEPMKNLHPYAQKLLNVYFENKTKLILKFHILERKYNALSQLLCCKDCQGVQIQILKAMFPNVHDLEIKNVKLCIGNCKH